jgi:hypothetical protein
MPVKFHIHREDIMQRSESILTNFSCTYAVYFFIRKSLIISPPHSPHPQSMHATSVSDKPGSQYPFPPPFTHFEFHQTRSVALVIYSYFALKFSLPPLSLSHYNLSLYLYLCLSSLIIISPSPSLSPTLVCHPSSLSNPGSLYHRFVVASK